MLLKGGIYVKYKLQGDYLTLIIDDDFHHKTIRDIFNYLHLSKKTIHLLKQDKNYTLNNQFINDNHLLNKNDHLKIKAFNQEAIDYIPQEYPLSIAYEDDFILIVNKPINTTIYPETKKELNTLCNYVANYYLETNQYLPIRHIHRLDKDTTGLVLFCKCPLLQPLLDNMMANKLIKRSYIAICKGIIDHDLTINRDIARDRHVNKMRVTNKGLKAITEIKVIKHDKQRNYTVCKCDLKTGRKHQIRVHLASINHPLLSDPLYGNKSKLIDRVALHAYKLEFIHPVTKQQIIVKADLPQDMNFINIKKDWL